MDSKKMKFTLLAIGAVMFGGGAVHAGYKSWGNNVVVYSDNSGAYGSLADTRATSNTTESIGCHAYVNGTLTYAYCVAADKLGHVVSCITYDPVFSQRAAAINGDSHIQFFKDAGGTCTYLHIMQDSSLAPKAP
jgi:hypothetical protein